MSTFRRHAAEILEFLPAGNTQLCCGQAILELKVLTFTSEYNPSAPTSTEKVLVGQEPCEVVT